MISLRSVVHLPLIFLVVAFACPAAAGDVDLLIQKLVSKGILTESDAQELTAEIAREARAPTPAVRRLNELPAVGAVARTQVDHLKRIRFTGDLRVRYQPEDLDNVPLAGTLNVEDRDRWRLRWRAGVVAEPAEQWQVGFGLASGGADARSSNQTLRRGFSTGDARLDYAYARYSPSAHVAVVAGKFKNPLWAPKDLLWDSDLRPEGLALPVVFTYGDNIEAFVTPAYLVLSEHVAGRQADASMLVLQAGAAFAVTDRLALTVAPTYYNFAGLEGEVGPVILNVPSNSRDGGGNLVNDYDAITLGGELGIAGRDWMPNLSIFGEWVKTFDPESDNTGWLLGFSVGEADVTHGGDWRFSYNYRRLEADSWPDFLTDSDHFFGATNVRGSEFEFAWGIADGVNVSLDYYSGVEFLGTDIEQQLLQLDLNVSW